MPEIVYDDTHAFLQAAIEPGFARDGETPDEVNIRYIKYLMAMNDHYLD